MITRIVKMRFQPDGVEEFLDIFKGSQERIRAFPGCHQVILYRDKRDRNTFFTYSLWETEEALERYRESELFRSTWKKTKKLFAEKPAAWSLEELRS